MQLDAALVLLLVQVPTSTHTSIPPSFCLQSLLPGLQPERRRMAHMYASLACRQAAVQRMYVASKSADALQQTAAMVRESSACSQGNALTGYTRSEGGWLHTAQTTD